MSIEKSLLKRDTIDELGNELNDLLDGSRTLIHQKDGGVEALNTAKGMVLLNASKAIDEDLEAGKIDLEMAKLIKGYVTICSGTIGALHSMWVDAKSLAQGRTRGLEEAVAVAKKARDVQHHKAIRALEVEEEEAQKAKEDAEKQSELTPSPETKEKKPRKTKKVT